MRKTTGPVEDVLNGKLVRIQYDAPQRRLIIQGETGEAVKHLVAFLADLRAFYPTAERYQFPKER